MKMKFDIEKAIDNSIDIIYGLEDFYRTYNGFQNAYIKIEDGYFIICTTGNVSLEYNREGMGPELPDHTFISDICNVKHCHKTEEEIREQIKMFFYNIPPIGA